MTHADFAYAVAADSAGFPLAVSIFSGSAKIRVDMREDAEIAGFGLRECGALAMLLEGEVRPLGELVFLDCPELSGQGLAALTRLDERVARSGARLIVSTSLDALDAVFGCCAMSDPQILVNPRRADRVIALGRMLADLPKLQVRELSEADRIALLRLTEQVGQIAERLDRLGEPCSACGEEGQGTGVGEHGRSAFRLASPVDTFRLAGEDSRGLRATRPPLPDPRLVRRIIQQRQMRQRFFDGDLFADPAWDMLLDLTASRVEHTRVSVTSLCIASGVPPTTALRWISQLTDVGLLERSEDETDRRRAFIQLTDKAVDAMARYFQDVGKLAAQMA